MSMPIKLVDSCWIFFETWSDTFRNVLVYGKEQESQKIFYNHAKKIHLPEKV